MLTYECKQHKKGLGAKKLLISESEADFILGAVERQLKKYSGYEGEMIEICTSIFDAFPNLKKFYKPLYKKWVRKDWIEKGEP